MIYYKNKCFQKRFFIYPLNFVTHSRNQNNLKYSIYMIGSENQLTGQKTKVLSDRSSKTPHRRKISRWGVDILTQYQITNGDSSMCGSELSETEHPAWPLIKSTS